jgi:hypothetical protein
MSKLKDLMGNELNEGDYVSVGIDHSKLLLWVAKIGELSEGGLTLAIDKGRTKAPAKIRLILDITLTANADMPFFPMLAKIVSPGSSDLINKMTGGSEEPPKPS